MPIPARRRNERLVDPSAPDREAPLRIGAWPVDRFGNSWPAHPGRDTLLPLSAPGDPAVRS